ncbi:hypothetical protein AGE08_23630 [Salmonella enterica subsp. enterica serovar Kentucky]|nr:hypothetical protein AGE08_23630 [Salmonella enterica subsp. enterica serovar Kentucky]
MNSQLYIRNYTHDTNYEIVATLDGVDAANGKAGSLNHYGYLVNGGDSTAINGRRKAQRTESAAHVPDGDGAYAP